MPSLPSKPRNKRARSRVAPSDDVPADPYYTEIAEKIRRQIRAGLLKPGDELPSRREIAAEHGVSEAPVRQALAQLDREGVIVLRQGKRATVAGPPGVS